MGRIALIGFGEAGQAVAGGLQAHDLRAYDIKIESPRTRDGLQAACASGGVAAAGSLASALAGADLVFSLVTADQALVVAQAAAKGLEPGALYFDGNSCAPETKRAAAAILDAAGGRYVDMAVMAPVHPLRHRVPLLISGPHGAAGTEVLTALGMNATLLPGEVGRASSVKMLRSVMIKGLEALVAECMLGARRAGVEDLVLASLQKSDPGIQWRDRAAYNLERMGQHGVRRAAEMREVALTMRQLGLPDRMSAAIVDWQQQIGDLQLPGGVRDLADMTDAILAVLPPAP